VARTSKTTLTSFSAKSGPAEKVAAAIGDGKTYALTIRLDRDRRNALREFSLRDGRSVQKIIDGLIDEFLEKTAKRK
jgi:hypothetical protein